MTKTKNSLTNTEWSRRDVITLGASLSMATMIDSLLSGCKTRSFATKPGSSNAYSQFFQDSFMDHYNSLINDDPSKKYADFFIEELAPTAINPADGSEVANPRFNQKLADWIGADAGRRQEMVRQSLTKLMMLMRIKKDPVNLVFKELAATRTPYLNPASAASLEFQQQFPQYLAPVLVLSYELVTEKILNPQNTIMLPGTPPNDFLKIAKDTEVNRFRLLPYHPEMPNLTGHYMLCDDDVKRHDAEKAYTHKYAVKKEDGNAVISMIAKEADNLVDSALKSKNFVGTIDVVRDLARWLPLKVVSNYFGVPSGENAFEFTLDTDGEAAVFGLKKGDKIKPTEQQMYIWIANSFRNLFLNLGRDPTIAKAGRRSGAQLFLYMYKIIKQELANPSANLKETMLGRLCARYTAELAEKKKDPNHIMPSIFVTENPSEKDPSGGPNLLFGVCEGPEYRITAQLAGSVAGAGVTVEESIARIFNVLFLPENAAALAECIKISATKDYLLPLRAYCYEALRFQPQAEMIPRFTMVRSSLGADDSKNVAEQVPAGTLVFASIYTAMHDPVVAGTTGKGPNEFFAGRDEKYYLHFGFARNVCLGRYIAPVEMIEALRAVLVKSNQPALTQAMKFSKEAPFADSDDLGMTDEKGPYAASLLIQIDGTKPAG